MSMRSFVITICLSALVLVDGAVIAWAQPKPITVAVVRDGPSREDELADNIEQELKLLVPRGTTVTFKRSPSFDIGWNPSAAAGAVRAALADPDVDYVLVTGFLGTIAAASRDVDRRKPVVCAYPIPTDIVGIPYSDEGTSLLENLVFITVPFRLVEDIEAFKSLVPIDTLHVTVEPGVAEELRAHEDRIEAYEARIGVQLESLPIGEDEAAWDRVLSKRVKAVLLGYTPRLSQDERRKLIDLVNERGIPSFSFLGHSDVELGALAAVTPDFSREVARRTAMNLSELHRGVAPGDLPVTITPETSLLINANTAAAIGYEPSVSVRARATFLHPEYLEAGTRPLTLEDAMRNVQTQNISLRVKDSDVERARREAQVYRSPMLPQLSAGASGTGLNNDFLTQILPEEQGNAGFSLTQMIYDDRLVSNYRSTKRIFESAQQEREVVRLDVVTEAGQAFLGLVLARALHRIALENYQLTADNLDLARRRLEAGYSGRDEVYRWESELATRRIDVYHMESSMEARRIALNQVLALDQRIRWVPQDVEVREDEFYFLGGRITGVFGDADAFNGFREFSVAFSIENAPELRAFDTALEAQRIQLGQRKRQFILPRFGLSADYNYNFYRDPDKPGLDRNLYTLQLFATLPLFEGGGRYYDTQRVKAQVEGLEHERSLARNRVEQRTRTAVATIENSFPTIAFSRSAAANAERNLEVVQEKYAQGIVNVTDLLTAQSASFLAKQNAVITTYSFLLDLLAYQRALAWFEVDKTSAEVDELVQRILSATGLE